MLSLTSDCHELQAQFGITPSSARKLPHLQSIQHISSVSAAEQIVALVEGCRDTRLELLPEAAEK